MASITRNRTFTAGAVAGIRVQADLTPLTTETGRMPNRKYRAVVTLPTESGQRKGNISPPRISIPNTVSPRFRNRDLRSQSNSDATILSDRTAILPICYWLILAPTINEMANRALPKDTRVVNLNATNNREFDGGDLFQIGAMIAVRIYE